MPPSKRQRNVIVADVRKMSLLLCRMPFRVIGAAGDKSTVDDPRRRHAGLISPMCYEMLGRHGALFILKSGVYELVKAHRRRIERLLA